MENDANGLAPSKHKLGAIQFVASKSIPVNKIMGFGGDYHNAENVYGHQQQWPE